MKKFKSKIPILNIRFLSLMLMVFFFLSHILWSQKKKTHQVNNKITSRILHLEDQLEILQLLAGSSISSDVASEMYWKNMFTEDAIFDRGKGKIDSSKVEILKIINDPAQKTAISFGMTHLPLLPLVTIKGDFANATGYLLTIIPDSTAAHVKLPGKGVSPGFSIYQLTLNRWDMKRTPMGWRVSKRTVRSINSADTQTILKQAIGHKQSIN